jgi:hypothetical protein
MVFVFVAAEWVILFHPRLSSSVRFLRQAPQTVDCPNWPQAETAFFNLKVWVIVSLAQAIIWGVVTYASIRWLFDLWRTGEQAGRWRRVVTVILRSLIFGLGLWFFLTPVPYWHLGCFSQHLSAQGAGSLAYVAVGSATIVMWILENRVCKLADTRANVEAVHKYLELRQKLQTLLSMSSLVLVLGVIGLVTRQAFIEPLSMNIVFPHSIVLEGLEYTILLGLAYAPVHSAFSRVGGKIRDDLTPYPSRDDVAAIQQWSRLSNELGDVMQIGLHDWKRFGPGFPILAPFLLSLLSTLVKHQ